MNRLHHATLVIDLAVGKEIRLAADAPVRDEDWIPFLEQMIANRKFK